MAVYLRQSGTSVPTLHTPMGTFHNVLSVHFVLQSVAFTNITKAVSKELGAAIKPTITKELSTVAWYAPGLVRSRTSAGGYTSSVTSRFSNSSPRSHAATG